MRVNECEPGVEEKSDSEECAHQIRLCVSVVFVWAFAVVLAAAHLPPGPLPQQHTHTAVVFE